jgi:hypothetical protein
VNDHEIIKYRIHEEIQSRLSSGNDSVQNLLSPSLFIQESNVKMSANFARCFTRIRNFVSHIRDVRWLKPRDGWVLRKISGLESKAAAADRKNLDEE